jgi:hypothetical protein
MADVNRVERASKDASLHLRDTVAAVSARQGSASCSVSG